MTLSLTSGVGQINSPLQASISTFIEWKTVFHAYFTGLLCRSKDKKYMKILHRKAQEYNTIILLVLTRKTVMWKTDSFAGR